MAVSKNKGGLRWLSEPVDNFMIRLGFVTAVCSVADAATTSADKIVRGLESSICKELPLPSAELGPPMAAIEAYRDAKVFEGRNRTGRMMKIWPQIELQDLYICDPEMPSNLGALAHAALHEMLDWSSWLGFVRARSNVLTSDGWALRALAAGERQAAIREYSRRNNPFLFREGSNPTPERSLLLFRLLCADGDLISALLDRLLDAAAREGSLPRKSVVPLYRDSLKALLDEDNSRRERLELSQVRALRREIANLDSELGPPEGRSTAGPSSSDQPGGSMGQSARVTTRPLQGLNRVSPRLENLVDLGFLANASAGHPKLDFVYSPLPSARPLQRYLAARDRPMEEYLSNGLFEFLAGVEPRGARKASGPEEVLSHVAWAYSRYYRPFGGKPIEPLSRMAACRALAVGGPYFEIADVPVALLSLHEQHPNDVAISGGHTYGIPEFVSISKTVLDRYPNA